MMKTLRKNNKKILAIFTALLMVAFIADTGYRRYADAGEQQGYVVGRAGDVELRSTDVSLAEHDLRLLLNIVQETGQADRQFVSLLEGSGLPEQVIVEWMNKPVTFALLTEEARRVPGAMPQSPADIDLSRLLVRVPERGVVPLSAAPDREPHARRAIATLLGVLRTFERAGNVLKISQPAALHQAVRASQQITVQFVEVDAEPLLDGAPQPTDAQLAEQFRKYADVPPSDVPTPSNPLGFGYRYPPRVKFQYVAVPREQVKAAVIRKGPAGMSGSARDMSPEDMKYNWDVAGLKYYMDNQKQFQAEPSATQPATQPTTRPFAEVREDVIDRLTAPQVNSLTDEIRRKIESTTQADYQAWAKVHAPTTAPTTGPATAPAHASGTPAPATRPVVSSMGVPYDSYEYLQKLAESVQQQYGVLPTVAQVAELKSEEDVLEMGAVGTVAREAFYVAEPFVPAARRDDPAVLSVMEPSKPRADAGGTSYAFRVTEADPAHAPADLGEVRERVAQDVRRQWAWDQAKAAAQRIYDAARSAGEGLVAAAGERPVTTAGPFPRLEFAPVAGADFDEPASRAAFVDESYKMLAEMSADNPKHHPLRVIELPASNKVLVAELASVETAADPARVEMERVRLPLQVRQEWAMRMAPRWLGYDGVIARMGYTDAQPARTASASP